MNAKLSFKGININSIYKEKKRERKKENYKNKLLLNKEKKRERVYAKMISN